MNLRDLEYFAAVAELGHFGAASERCFVSQPTLSGQLRKLEEELGHSLFDRDTRNVRLTPFGKEALPLAQAVLQAARSLQERAQELKDPFRGAVRLGGFPTLAPWLFPLLFPLFSRSYPHAEFFLVEEKTPVLQKQIQEGFLDAAFLAMPQDAPSLHALPLFSEPFLLAIPGTHPWKARKGIRASELSELELLLLEDGHCLRDQAIDLCFRYGAREKGQFRATGLETLRQMVRLGTGITLMPRLAIPESKESGIVYLPIREPVPTRQIALCFRDSHPRRRFFEDLATHVRSLCAPEKILAFCTELGD
ncbi:MAG: hypothetical protein RL318_1123 [Fibrobacterota bacterium]